MSNTIQNTTAERYAALNPDVAEWLEVHTVKAPATIDPSKVNGIDTEGLYTFLCDTIDYGLHELSEGNLTAIFRTYESLGYGDHYAPALENIVRGKLIQEADEKAAEERFIDQLTDGVNEMFEQAEEAAHTAPVIDVKALEAMDGLDDRTAAYFKEELPRLRGRRLAAQYLDAEERAAEHVTREVQGVDIDDFLSIEFEAEPWIIDGLISEGTLTLAYSVGKAGKSYFVHQLTEAMATGIPFLGEFEAHAPNGNVGLVDLELPTRKLQQRLRKYDWSGKLRVYPLRGQLPGAGEKMKFDLSDEYNRAQWVERWKADGIEYLIVDPLSAVIRDAGMSEWNEAGLALRHLQNMMDAAEIRAMVVVTHSSGKEGKESAGPRGDSAQIDVPDNVWKLVNDHDANTLTLEASQTREEPIGVVMDWTEDKKFTLAGTFDPFSEGGGEATVTHYADVGSRLLSRLYTQAREHAETHDLAVDFESVGSKSAEEFKDMWPNKTTVIEWLVAEGKMSKNEAENRALPWLEESSHLYLQRVGKTRNMRFVPVLSESSLTFSDGVKFGPK